MTAKELMIGDWVINTEGKEQIRDVVRKISPEFLGLRYSRRYVPIECIEPIPLTPELLIANGFDIKETKNEFYSVTLCKIRGPKGSWFEDIGQRVSFLYDKHGDSIFPIVSLNNNDHDNIFGSFKYVHQLQHAFRMLQYDDLADNFKVI